MLLCGIAWTKTTVSAHNYYVNSSYTAWRSLHKRIYSIYPCGGESKISDSQWKSKNIYGERKANKIIFSLKAAEKSRVFCEGGMASTAKNTPDMKRKKRTHTAVFSMVHPWREFHWPAVTRRRKSDRRSSSSEWCKNQERPSTNTTVYHKAVMKDC